MLLCLLFGKSITAIMWDSVTTLDVLDMSIVFKDQEGLYLAYCPEVIPLIFYTLRRAYAQSIQESSMFSHSAEDIHDPSIRKSANAPASAPTLSTTALDDREAWPAGELHRRIVRLFGYLLASDSATSIHVSLRRRDVLEAIVETLFLTCAPSMQEAYKAFVDDIYDVISMIVWTSLFSERKIVSVLELVVDACPPLVSDTQFVTFQNRYEGV